MYRRPKVAPSLLSADFMKMSDAVQMLEAADADWMHVDVMDGHFVPNITMGVPFVKCLKPITKLPIDAHLMVSNPLDQIPWFIEAGADIISFHIEAVTAEEAHRAIDEIHDAGILASIAIKPKTPMEALANLVSELDMILVMSVEPGFSGQGFIEGSDTRVAQAVALAKEAGVSPLIQVDGGIDPTTAPLVAASGADVFVSGNFVLKAKDPALAIADIKAEALKAVAS